MWHYQDFAEWRRAEIVTLDPLSLAGMVTFPSFHVAAGILVAYAARGIRFVGSSLLAHTRRGSLSHRCHCWLGRSHRHCAGSGYLTAGPTYTESLKL